MQVVEQIKLDNYEKIRLIYEDFRNKALKDYKYQNQPIEFENFISAIEENNLSGLVLFEDENPEGILIYSQEKYDKEAISMTGTELGYWGDDKLAWRKAANDFYKKNLQGTYVERSDIGKIYFYKNGLKKTISNSADLNRLRLIPKIKEIIETGKLSPFSMPRRIKTRKGLKGYYYINKPVTINGEIFNTRITIGSDINGNWYYNINVELKLIKLKAAEFVTEETSPGKLNDFNIIISNSTNNFKVMEINVVHSNHRAVLLDSLIKMLKDRADCDIISYPMLGIQETGIKEISALGFNFVGQSVVRFDFQDPVSYRVLKLSGDVELQDNTLSIWDDKYKEQVIELIHLAFKNNKITNFDPRFLSMEGTKIVVEMILANQYGNFLSGQTRLLLNNDNVEGVCFAALASEDKINVPLIAVRKSIRNKGMGKLLLRSVIGGFVKLISEKGIPLKEINATVDTDNYPAIKMYRRLGFREEYFYPHAYIKNDLSY
ncbi:MAG: hypothetical protein A2Y25_04845 [Candidatus Melainabacteria bacterium GWF2_37_15]|nr:MAG: hypothetical protein A2Y25_04845 [Candidatus Melainabacteria bacterium GWF2_37_15]